MVSYSYKDIKVTWIHHASFMLEYNDKVIYIDPFKLDFNSRKGDLILITHEHYDHLSIEDMRKIVKSDTVICAPTDSLSKLSKFSQTLRFLELDEKMTIHGLTIETVPAYNIDKPFHQKSNSWFGYVLRTNETSLYHTGDTDLIPEMNDIENIDIFMPCIGGTYTMDYEEAFKALKIIKPKVVIPMHYGLIVGENSDLDKFVKLIKDNDIEVEVVF